MGRYQHHNQNLPSSSSKRRTSKRRLYLAKKRAKKRRKRNRADRRRNRKGAKMETGELFKSDLSEYRKFVGKAVKVTTYEGNVSHGTFQTIDPQSKSVVLIVPKENYYELLLISGECKPRLELTHEDNIGVMVQAPRKHDDISVDRLTADRLKVEEALKKARIPLISSSNNGIVLDNIIINPPFTSDACVSTNPVVLARVRSILEWIHSDK